MSSAPPPVSAKPEAPAKAEPISESSSWAFSYEGQKSGTDDRFCMLCAAASTARCPSHGPVQPGCATCNAAKSKACPVHAGFMQVFDPIKATLPSKVVSFILDEVSQLPEGNIRVHVQGHKNIAESHPRVLKMEIIALR